MPTDSLITRLNEAFGPMREVAMGQLEMWLNSHERRQGGLLVVQASWRGRDLVEASYRSEVWPF